MKINYPIKYAVMPIIDEINWDCYHEIDRVDDVLCYIVSKCYKIRDITNYYKDGRLYNEYEIVFPYQKSEFSRWRRTIPEYNLMNGNCINSDKVPQVFDSYEEALIQATAQNDELFKKSLGYLAFTKDTAEKIKKMKKNFDTILAKYKVLEQQILLLTDNLEIGQKKVNDVIKIANNKQAVLSCDIYEILRLFDNDKFIVYSIKQEQYDILAKSIIKKEDNKDTADKINQISKEAQVLLFHKEKDMPIEIATTKDQGIYYIKNDILYYDEGTDKVEKDNIGNIEPDTLIFYTTETREDLLKSYEEYPEINLKNIPVQLSKKST